MISRETFTANLIKDCKTLAKHHGRLLTSMEVVELAAAIYDAETRDLKKPKPKPKPQSQMTDEEWIAMLMQEPHLQGVDVRREISACTFWCKNTLKSVPSRRRIINWLNKAERTLTAKASGATFATGLRAPNPLGPTGWEKWLERNIPSSDHPASGQLLAALNCKGFHMMPQSWRERCSKEMEGRT